MVTGQQALPLNATDVGDLLGKSPSATGVEVQRRNPIADEPIIRGYHLGQIVTVADGAYWFPARQDLDTFLSKIDAGLIQDAVVVKGPYSVRYGPGFSFIDIETRSPLLTPNGTPYDHFEAHGRILGEYQFNGRQINGLVGLSAGDCDWGVRVTYDKRTGDNYKSGNDTYIPSSYNTGDVDVALGIRPTTNSELIFGYMRLDQTDLDFPGQIFDTDFLISDAYRLRYVLKDQSWFDRFTVDGYYNHTAMSGNAQDPEKLAFIPQLAIAEQPIFIPGLPPIPGFSGFTHINQMSSGYRAAMEWGKAQNKEAVLAVGTDLRYQSGTLNELDQFHLNLPFNFPVPSSDDVDVGFFVDYSVPVNDCFSFRLGARADYATEEVLRIPFGGNFATPADFFRIANLLYFDQVGNTTASDYSRDAGMWMAYATADYKLNDNWTVTAGTGHAERRPTLTQLYAMGPYLAVLQQGFTTVVGNPNLADERLYQFDLGLNTRYDRFRAGVTGFASLVDDYITYAAIQPGDPRFAYLSFNKFSTSFTNALPVQFTNTGLAVLAGFEFYGEADVLDWLTPYATISYVGGRDLERGDRPPGVIRTTSGLVTLPGAAEEPLPGIPPLQARLGLRFHEATCKGQAPRYGMEFESILVAEQNRIAASLGEQASGGYTIFNIRGYWQLTPYRGQTVLLTAGIQNMFDREYRTHLDLLTGRPQGPGVLEPGFSPYLGLEYRW